MKFLILPILMPLVITEIALFRADFVYLCRTIYDLIRWNYGESIIKIILELKPGWKIKGPSHVNTCSMSNFIEKVHSCHLLQNKGNESSRPTMDAPLRPVV